jgi:hypothetical protein
VATGIGLLRVLANANYVLLTHSMEY